MKVYAHCYRCPSHRIISDPDPSDWFCDDDSAMVCAEVKTDGRTIAGAKRRKSKRTADYSKIKVVSCALRPYEIRMVKAPSWCPRKKA